MIVHFNPTETCSKASASRPTPTASDATTSNDKQATQQQATTGKSSNTTNKAITAINSRSLPTPTNKTDASINSIDPSHRFDSIRRNERSHRIDQQHRQPSSNSAIVDRHFPHHFPSSNYSSQQRHRDRASSKHCNTVPPSRQLLITNIIEQWIAPIGGNKQQLQQ